MSKLKKIENESLFSVKESVECTDYAITDDINVETGDTVDRLESTEYIEARNEAEKFLETYKSKTPSDYTEVNENTLIHYFGKKRNWNGEFANCSTIISRRTSYASTQLQWYNSIFDYITNPALVPAGMTKYSNILAQINGNYNRIINSINGVNLSIQNLKNFRFSTENPMAILNSTDYALANLQYMFTQVDGAVDYAMGIYDQMKGAYSKVQKILDLDNVKNLSEMLSNKMQQVASNIAKNLADLPGTLLNKFLNCSFVQNMFTLPLRVYGFVMNAIGIVLTIRMPTNLKDVIAIFGILRKAVSEMKNAVSAITNAINQVKQVANMIKNGNWYGMLGMLNTQGSLNGFKIVEKPSSFAAKYPENSAYTTAGGHTIEIDNTEGHERLHVEHKSGTSFEMATSGDLLGKVRKDSQLIIDGNCEIATKGNMQLQANKKLEMTFNEIKIEASKDINFSGANMVFTSGMTPGNMTTINGFTTFVSSSTSTTVSSLVTTNVSGVAGVEISSNGVISINGPLLEVNCPKINVRSAEITIMTTTLISMAASITMLQSSGTNQIRANGANILQAPSTRIGGL